MHNEDHNPLNRSPYCGDPAALVSYLYNDGSADELNAIASHVQACDRCTMELAALGDTRDVLSAWSPPQTELGFTLSSSDVGPVPAALAQPEPVSSGGAASPVPWWRQATPVWMQAVAATVVFGAGLARRHVRPGRHAGGAGRGHRHRRGRVDGELSDLEARLRAELTRLSATRAAAPAPVQAAARPDTEALLRQVQSLLADSEERWSWQWFRRR